ncbi:MAG: hypothetical protein LCH98_17680 [Actinobacteria bacterium]|nr:hypothetical protein [Actinomycetota bacterium]
MQSRWAAVVGAASVALAGTILATASGGNPPADQVTSVGVAAALATVSASPPPPPALPPSPSPSPSPSASPAERALPAVKARAEWGTPAEGGPAAQAIQVVGEFLAAADAAYATLELAPIKDDKLAIGSARGEVQAGLQELAAAQRRQVGTVTVTKASAFTQKQPHRLLVVACLDSSAVQVVQDGDATEQRPGVRSTPHVLRSAAPAGTRLDLHEFVLQETGKRWVVLSHAMPIDTRCER